VNIDELVGEYDPDRSQEYFQKATVIMIHYPSFFLNFIQKEKFLRNWPNNILSFVAFVETETVFIGQWWSESWSDVLRTPMSCPGNIFGIFFCFYYDISLYFLDLLLFLKAGGKNC
jgi:hypothetical protein